MSCVEAGRKYFESRPFYPLWVALKQLSERLGFRTKSPPLSQFFLQIARFREAAGPGFEPSLTDPEPGVLTSPISALRRRYSLCAPSECSESCPLFMGRSWTAATRLERACQPSGARRGAPAPLRDPPSSEHARSAATGSARRLEERAEGWLLVAHCARLSTFTTYGFPQRIRSASTYAGPDLAHVRVDALEGLASVHHSPPINVSYSRSSSDFAVSISGPCISSFAVLGSSPHHTILSGATHAPSLPLFAT